MGRSALIFLVFILGALPLVWQDLRDRSVSQGLLLVVFLAWFGFSWFVGDSCQSALPLSAGVLVVGTLALLSFPGWFGEADAIFMAGIALLIPFWGFLLAVGIACILGFVAFAWLSHFGRRDVSGVALAFLPCLALGGFFVLGGQV